jgi:hypothetical protein
MYKFDILHLIFVELTVPPDVVAAQAYVAFAIDSGSIGLVKVLQRLQTQTHATDYPLEVSIEVCSPQILEAEKQRVTMLTWVNPPDHSVS